MYGSGQPYTYTQTRTQGPGLVLSALIARPELCARLEGSLSDLGPKLGSVAVLLRTLVLPAMPWLSVEAGDRVQVGMWVCVWGARWR
jgi:hypothetical protein